MTEGLVVRIEPRTWIVEVEGRDVPCSLKPRLFEGESREKGRVAVGDRVLVALEGERGVVVEVLPRRNRLARPTPRDRDVLQVTAANVDVLVIVSAAADPPLRRGLIDRFLVAAEKNEMDALIVVNKCDKPEGSSVREQVEIYQRLGYPVLLTAAATGQGVPELAVALAGKTALFVGHSGVGKSSLLNAIDPTLVQRTSGLAKHGRGRHTTTSVSLWRLANGGHLVDSPGIRGFGLHDIPSGELGLLMPDLAPFTRDCRFPDCSHDHEPHCAVRAALERGAIDRERYESYLRMLKSLDGDEDED